MKELFILLNMEPIEIGCKNTSGCTADSFIACASCTNRNPRRIYPTLTNNNMCKLMDILVAPEHTKLVRLKNLWIWEYQGFTVYSDTLDNLVCKIFDGRDKLEHPFNIIYCAIREEKWL